MGLKVKVQSSLTQHSQVVNLVPAVSHPTLDLLTFTKALLQVSDYLDVFSDTHEGNEPFNPWREVNMKTSVRHLRAWHVPV